MGMSLLARYLSREQAVMFSLDSFYLSSENQKNVTVKQEQLWNNLLPLLSKTGSLPAVRSEARLPLPRAHSNIAVGKEREQSSRAFCVSTFASGLGIRIVLSLHRGEW